MKKTTKKKVVKNDFIDKVYDGTDYVPQMSAIDLNDYNQQMNLPADCVPADGGLKDDLNDIKILLKSMNNNLNKILHHLNGGWN